MCIKKKFIKRTGKNSFNSFTVAEKARKHKAFRGEKTAVKLSPMKKFFHRSPPGKPTKWGGTGTDAGVIFSPA
jgi:hypothetical protein